MDGGSCTHCICSMAALGESTGKFDVDKHVSYKGHSGSLSLTPVDLSNRAISADKNSPPVVSGFFEL